MTPTLIAVSVVYFSFSRAAQPEAQGPSSQLDDGFLYCILSPTGLQNSIRSPDGPFRPGVAFPTTSCLRRLWSPTDWLPVLTELYNSSTPTQSTTQTLEWHVWSSSSGNNCHAVQRSLSSGASVYECIMGFYLVPFHQPNLPKRSLSITGYSFRCITLEWHVCPGLRSIYNTCCKDEIARPHVARMTMLGHMLSGWHCRSSLTWLPGQLGL